ncbi:hypothetical protein DICPUDRAFT_148081 [Dictyostelium purpureum]|uniref:ABC transporter domain-containing protein n=1 Tax=Dictyostelium purpureum TaxID=5786 RepID=F0ZA69_DICPU|nr:uncharacterized protein DICPUDRAFT_148081 [Dictyostelium purpureum]EGC39183.1 hypothetical protein DICPUDRAFT_148081 [Dictyostelium purpureum]|eukprot:XP_003284329.1 hypothetical protein DICPUDRAFT_148081 [Dictyostelium purpureum]
MSREYELNNLPNLDSGGDYGGDNNNNNNNNNNIVGANLSDSNESNDELPITVSRGLDNFNKVADELEKEYKDYVTHEHALKDIEATYEETEEDFKLRNYFENSQRMALENGGKPKKMGVIFKNLTVVGKGADASIISDLSTPFIELFSLLNPKKWKSNTSTFDILHDVTGFCKDGQMLLVLGRPGSGCSTLLRVICNQRESYVKVTGDVTYGGIPATEWGRYKGEAIYIPEEDSHYPTLTVRETLDFALKCKTPSNRLPEEKKRTFRSKIFSLLLSMFGIVHQADTMVGNEFVRGLSGGERKRITIAESMVAASSINCYDCSTRGLDAASAFDYAKSIRIMSDSLHKTTVATFYQASDSIFNLFDKVLILEKGRCIYFGPTSMAKEYFLNLGFHCEARKSTPDFLTGVTNPQERKIQEGFEGRVPETSADFETAWKNSALYQQQLEELEVYEKKVEIEQPKNNFIQEVRSQKSKTTSKKSAYTTGFWAQVLALTIRNYQIIWGDKFSLISRYFSTIIQAILYGTLFFKMTNTTLDDAYNRGGALFCTILFNALLSEQELPIAFYGRRIIQKQRSYAMYRPSALHLAQVATDIPVIFVQVFLFSFIVYFMYGLELSGSKFFIFVFTLIGFSLCFNNLYRLWGNFTPSVYIAQNIMNVLVITQFTYSGYYIPYEKMNRSLQWYYWANPITYAYKALMANEFADMKFDCLEMIPYSNEVNSTTYSDPAYRACPTIAADPGQNSFYGSSYLSKVMDLKSNDLALNVCVVYLFWVLFIVINCIVMEFFDWTSGGYTSKVYKRGKAPKMNDVDEEKRQNEMVANATSNMKETLKMPGGIFTWQNINYTVPVPGGTRLLLDNVEGWIKPGQMTALMGSSGAGKTTLLDVLAKRKTIGEVKGKCYLNGKALEMDFERITGYVEQMDVHNPGLTVREALRFSAKLRQEPHIPLEEKFAYVEQVLEMMEMKHLGDALIGDLETGVGISVEERKRLTIGVELVSKPHILFLDEPTSGLDAQSSYNIIKFIRKLADAGMPLVCTIHQPSSVLFEHFDRILLLAKGGKTVYFGDIGEKSSVLLSYFERNGCRPCSEKENPAEYMLECIGAGVHGKSDKNWPELWKESNEYREIENELLSLEAAGPIKGHVDNGKPREFATSLFFQTWEVYKRLNLIWWRDPFYTYGTLIQCALVGLMTGFTFWNLGNSSTDMNQRVFFVFEAIILGILFMFLVLPQFITQKEYFKRDYASKFYSWLPFAVSIVVVELPFVLVSGTIFFFTSFWTAGLESSNSNNFYFWLMFIMFIFFCVSFGQAVGAVCFNLTFALNVLPILIVFFFLFCGLMVRPDDIPMFYREWIYKLNPCTYLLEGLITNVLNHVNVKCSLDDLVKFTKSPLYSTCEEYAFEFINGTTKGTGYVETINELTNECGYCAYKSGPEYFENHLGWSYSNRWRNFVLSNSKNLDQKNEGSITEIDEFKSDGFEKVIKIVAPIIILVLFLFTMVSIILIKRKQFQSIKDQITDIKKIQDDNSFNEDCESAKCEIMTIKSCSSY